MNTFFAFLLAGTLHATAPAETPVSNPAQTYLVNDQMAVWVSADQKMHLVLARNETPAEVELVDERSVYLHQRIDLREQTINQRYDLSNLPAGTYQLTIRVNDQVVRKTVTVRSPIVKRFVTLG